VAFEKKTKLFSGEVEVDETYMGGLRKNMPLKKRRATQSTAGRGVAGKFPIIGMKCRKTKKVVAKAIDTPRIVRHCMNSFIQIQRKVPLLIPMNIEGIAILIENIMVSCTADTNMWMVIYIPMVLKVFGRGLKEPTKARIIT